MTLSVAIVGSRDYPRLDVVRRYVQSLPEDTVVISGGARGVDSTAETAARTRGLQVLIFPAEWAKYGRSAGMRRNRDIIRYADRVVAFWDGQSPGTKNSIDLAVSMGKELIVVGPGTS